MKNKDQKNQFESIFKKALVILPLGLLGNLIFSYFHHDEFALENLLHSSFPWLFLAVLLGIVPWFTHALRMVIWTRFLGKKIPFLNLLRIAIGTDLGAAISPTATGGGPAKAFLIRQEGLKTGTAISLSLLGSVEDYTFFILAMPTALLISFSRKSAAIAELFQGFRIMNLVPYLSAVLILAVIVVILSKKWPNIWRQLSKISRIGKIGAWLAKIRREIAQVYSLIFRSGKRLFLLSVFITALHWCARFSIILALLSAFNISFNPTELFLMQWIVLISTLVIPTPGATGGAETFFYLVFQNTISQSLMGIILPAWRLLTYYVPVGLGSLVFLLLNHLQTSESSEREISIKKEIKPVSNPFMEYTPAHKQVINEY